MAKETPTSNDLQSKLERILEAAKKANADTNVYFETTLKRYIVQVKNLQALEKAIAEYGTFIKKEYVKGRENLVLNPAISEYNKTSSAANNTVQTLIKIVQALDMSSILDVEVGEDEL